MDSGDFKQATPGQIKKFERVHALNMAYSLMNGFRNELLKKGETPDLIWNSQQRILEMIEELS